MANEEAGAAPDLLQAAEEAQSEEAGGQASGRRLTDGGWDGRKGAVGQAGWWRG